MGFGQKLRVKDGVADHQLVFRRSVHEVIPHFAVKTEAKVGDEHVQVREELSEAGVQLSDRGFFTG